ncbi:MAG: hypothetical protein ACTH2G_11145, partial [Halomonadaceae bacterium]
TDCGLALNVFMDKITRLNVLGDPHRYTAEHHPYSFWLLTSQATCSEAAFYSKPTDKLSRIVTFLLALDWTRLRLMS